MNPAPTPDQLVDIKALTKKGRYLDAWESISNLAPPEDWPTVEGRLHGAYVLSHVGAAARGSRMVLREWARGEDRPETREDMFWEVLRRRGAYLTLRWLKRHAPSEDEKESRRIDHHGYLAYLFTQLRDFESAERELQIALRKRPDSRWFRLLHSDTMQRQDRRSEALSMVEEVLSLDPHYVSAVGAKAEILIELGRQDEALETLTRALESMQAPRLAAMAAGMHLEAGELDRASQALDQYEKLSPLLEPGDDADWLWGRRCAIASRRGDRETALTWARKAKAGYYRRIAVKLESAGPNLGARTLHVPFIRQHHQTCAPATMASLSAFWGRAVDHIDLAGEMCYDGTPDMRERRWAEENGWVVREFRVTLESAKALIDRGVPFVLNTVQPGNAHAQAVTGYDEIRSIFYVRDPGNPSTSEFLAEEALEDQRPFGPRGMAIVPKDRGSLFDGLVLPDAEAYDAKHAFELALSRHDRDEACRHLERLRENHPDHPLRWHTEGDLARYDGNNARALECLDRLLELHPGVVNWERARMQLVRHELGVETMVNRLRTLCAKLDAHPLLLVMLAGELQWDGRRVHETRRLLTRIHRQRVDSDAMLIEGNLRWDQGDRIEATRDYRSASCLDDKVAHLALTYFRAARWIKDTDEALRLLRGRYDREGHLSGAPAATLYQALEQLDRLIEGLDLLEDSVKRRPDDADHAVYAARELAAWGRVERARQILETLPNRTRAADWHRAKAQIASRDGDSEAELRQWRQVAEDQPLASDAHRAIASLLETSTGQDAAITYLRERCEKFPFHWPLHSALCERLQTKSPALWEEGVRHMLRIDPRNAWAHRELACALSDQERYAEAHEALDEAERLEPRAATLHSVRGSVMERENRRQDARGCFKRAVELDVDHLFAQGSFVRLSDSPSARTEALDFILQQLQTQTTNGSGVLEFADLARPYMDPEPLATALREAHLARQDLWQTSVALAKHLRETGKAGEAVELMRTCADKFPLIPRLWLELGVCESALPNPDGEVAALEKIRQLNPAWSEGMRSLSEAHRKYGRYATAREVLEQLIRHSPGDAPSRGFLAEVLWQTGERDAALDHLEKAVQLSPGYGWAWERLHDWGQAAGRPEAARLAALRLTEERPAEPRSWMVLADTLTEAAQVEERMEALRKAVALNPRSAGPRDELSRVLTLAGRFSQAREACHLPNDDVQPPMLMIREGWVWHRQGQAEKAIDCVNKALHADSAIAWGWKLLAEWHMDADAFSDAEAAVRELARLEPLDPIHWGYLASLRDKQGDRDGMITALERSLRVSPTYYYGFRRLFDLRIERDEHDEAARLLEEYRPHMGPADYHSRAFVLALARKRDEEALKELQDWIGCPDEDSDAQERVAAELKSHRAVRIGRRAIETVRAGMIAKDANPGAGALYVTLRANQGRLPDLREIEALPEGSKVALKAFEKYAYALTDLWVDRRKDVDELFGWRFKRKLLQLIRRHGEWMKPVPDLWGAVGYALSRMAKDRETIDWLAGWESREDCEPFILNNLVLALQKRNQPGEALRVVQKGVLLADHNPIKMRFHLWACIDHLLAGRIPDAKAERETVNRSQLDSYGTCLLDFVEAALPFADPSSNDPLFDSVVKNSFERMIDQNKSNPVMLDSVRQACSLASRRTRRFEPKIWHFGTRHKMLSMALVIGILLAWIRLVAR